MSQLYTINNNGGEIRAFINQEELFQIGVFVCRSMYVLRHMAKNMNLDEPTWMSTYLVNKSNDPPTER